MLKSEAENARVPARIVSIIVAVATFAACMLYSFSQAFAYFDPETAEQVIGVGRIQSSFIAASSADPDTINHFAAPQQLATEPTGSLSQLAQPLDRGIDNVEGVVEDISMIQRFGEPDEAGWFTTTASAYGPSSAGTHTATGTELTLTSADVAIQVNHMDLLGRYVEIMYGGVIVRCKIVDTGGLAPGRLFDLQPGVCTALGAETPEFGWGVRTIKWRFAD